LLARPTPPPANSYPADDTTQDGPVSGQNAVPTPTASPDAQIREPTSFAGGPAAFITSASRSTPTQDLGSPVTHSGRAGLGRATGDREFGAYARRWLADQTSATRHLRS
jgi:hypothetical protein